MSQSHGRLPWQLKVFPKVGFYKALHPYIKKKYKLAKVVSGKFYIDIDSNLKAKRSRPDNVYRFIEGVTTSKHTSSDMPMDYGIDRLHKKEVTEMETKVNECYQQIEELSAECSRLRDEFQLSQDQLRNTERILTDVTNQKSHLEKSCESNKKRIKKLVDQYMLLKRMLSYKLRTFNCSQILKNKMKVSVIRQLPVYWKKYANQPINTHLK